MSPKNSPIHQSDQFHFTVTVMLLCQYKSSCSTHFYYIVEYTASHGKELSILRPQEPLVNDTYTNNLHICLGGLFFSQFAKRLRFAKTSRTRRTPSRRRLLHTSTSLYHVTRLRKAIEDAAKEGFIELRATIVKRTKLWSSLKM